MFTLIILCITISIISAQHGVNWNYPCTISSNQNYKFCDYSLSFEERANDLVYNVEAGLSDNLTVWQSLFNVQAASIGELNIPQYQWGNEALHGIANSFGVNWNGKITSATMFPMPIGTSSSFNNKLFYQIGQVISTEARAMFNSNQCGLSFWAPNINIFRDPRWGRGQETPGEDPFLTSQYAKYFVRGMQGYSYNNSGSTPKYLKTAATPKHYADYSVEANRDSFNAKVTQYDQNDTYLVAFKEAIIGGNAAGIMCSYPAINGVPACADNYTMNTLARGIWGFDGYITSDCGAVEDIYTAHHYTNDWYTTDKVAIQAGCDIDCGPVMPQYTVQAVQTGVLPVESVQLAQYHLALVQMRQGLFDDPKNIPYTSLGASDVCTASSQALSLSAARQSIVLLKNNKNVLPINPSNVKGPAQIQGQNANIDNVMWGDYYGQPCNGITYSLADGISNYTGRFSGNTPILVFGAGLNQGVESENTDRGDISLGPQISQISSAASAAKSQDSNTIVILVIISGGCVDISEAQNDDNVDAIMWAGYGGMFGGLAIADVIFGTFAPLGRLTQTWYFNSFCSEQSMTNMNMVSSPGRGYRYYTGKVLYPFGFGLSYTTFNCTGLKVSGRIFSTTVTNSGSIDSGGVVLVYFIPSNAGNGNTPIKRLVGFGNIEMIKSKESESIQMSMYQEFDGTESGNYVLSGVCDSKML